MSTHSKRQDQVTGGQCVSVAAVERRIELPKVVGTLDYVTVHCPTQHSHTLPAVLFSRD